MAKEKSFSIGEAISFGWETFKKNYILLIALAAIYFVISGMTKYDPTQIKSMRASFNLIGWLINIFFQLGIITIALKLADREKAEIGDLFNNVKLYFRYLGATLLYLLIIAVGFILLVAPGIIWAIKFQFYGYLIIDKKMGILEALKKSAEITESVKWDLFGLGLAMIAIIILGAIVFGVGLFAAIPIIWLAVAFVYRELSPKTGGKREETPTEA